METNRAADLLQSLQLHSFNKAVMSAGLISGSYMRESPPSAGFKVLLIWTNEEKKKNHVVLTGSCYCNVTVTV